MRRSIRIALPAVAVATLLLSGCGDDDNGANPFAPGGNAGQQGGGDSGGEDAAAAAGGGEIGEIPMPGADSGGGDSGGESAAAAAGGGDSGAVSGGGDSGGGSAFTPGQLDGMWMENVTVDGSSMSFTGSSVTYVEDSGVEGDVCYGTLSGNTITVECNQFGEVLWPDTQATLSLEGSTLTVVWGSGTTEVYDTRY
ncbi:hypothetical protein [Streptomyces sp. URMC 129]|uniref:hypothetical protein n=1 Tax=Streptomyces sp. URMC 129 TaxID=3423407 RepID=UPI003F1E00FD